MLPVRVAPHNRDTREIMQNPNGGQRERLGYDPATGAESFILHSPPRQSPSPRHDQLEYHTCHEENILLKGRTEFAGWYSWEALGYLMHPPYWWHPAGYTFPDGVDILVRLEKPVDFTFRPVPENWDRLEWVEADAPHWCRNRAHSNLQLDTLPWEAVLTADGSPAGFDAKHIWDDVETNWSTWLMRAPAGFSATGTLPGGDELYLIDGDLTVNGTRLTEGGYYADPEYILNDVSTQGGFTALRWTSEHTWRLPPIRA